MERTMSALAAECIQPAQRGVAMNLIFHLSLHDSSADLCHFQPARWAPE